MFGADHQIDDATYEHCNGVSEHGNGGFESKLKAAEMVLKCGKTMIVGNINYNLTDVIAGNVPRTYFVAKQKR